MVALAVLVTVGCDKEEPAQPATTSATSPVTASVAPPPPPRPPSKSQRVLGAFFTWALEHRAAPDKTLKKRTCYKPGDPDAGWCDSSGPAIEGTNFSSVRYWKDDPTAARFEVLSVDGRAYCENFGAFTNKRVKKLGTDLTAISCKLSGKFDGMTVLIKQTQREPTSASVFLMTQKYLERDKAIDLP